MHMGESGNVARRGGSTRKRRSRGGEEIALQITAMADIFTVLLVFLLKSYSVSMINIDVNKDVLLPIANGGQESVEALKVQVSAESITVEGTPVVVLKDYEPVNRRDVQADGTYPEVVKALKREREKQRQIASEKVKQGEKPEEVAKAGFDGKLLVVADKKVPYKLLKNVLTSASAQDYTDFKLVVVNAD
jgi:biopolymer transport protein ExbD